MRNEFLEYVSDCQEVLVITSQPLDFDCIASGLLTKKYLESLGKRVKLIFSRQISNAERERNHFLPFFSEIEGIDSRKVLKSSKFDLLIFLDGTGLNQFYDSDNHPEELLAINLVSKRVHIDHHLNRTDQLGNLVIHDNKLSSTVEVLLTHVIPESFLDKDLATLSYAGIVGDTGNFKWAFSNSTFKVVSELLQKGAQTTEILESLYNSKDKRYFSLLQFILKQVEYFEDQRSIILSIPHGVVMENKFSDDDLSDLKSIFHAEISTSVKGFDRGLIIREKTLGNVEVSIRGGYQNKINLPEVFTKIGGKGGGHFNACSFMFGSNTVEKVKQMILLAFSEK